ncbi:MAG: AAA family ATPase [Candidatus Micrarchaeota archaeon]|nr:AAA family ATPase [Candidatus Micrarchaeota archaeon]
MAVIEKIVLHNFKSFKKAECFFGNGVIEITGPNGSGKSNIVDAIKFCLGEMNMKSLRAKSIKDLINENANIASVCIKFSNPNMEVKRIMNREGKVVYRINDEKVRRSDIINFLYNIDLDPSFYNVIPQGQVQKIVEMEPKKRRELIDALAGIAEYEEKKKEALRELETVQNRINEAQLILGERTAYLDSLQKEKEIAEKYIQAKEDFTRCRLSIIKKELMTFEEELKHNQAKKNSLTEQLKNNENELKSLESKLKNIEEKKKNFVDKINDLTKKEQLSKELANLNAEVKIIEKDIASLTEKINLCQNDKAMVLNKLKELDIESETMNKEIVTKTNQLKSLEQESTKIEKNDSLFKELNDLKTKLNELDNQISLFAQKKFEIVNEITKLNEKSNLIKSELDSIHLKLNQSGPSKENSVKELMIQKSKTESMIKTLFQEEKNLNNELPELDKKILELKEKVAELRINTKTNPFQSIISDLKTKINGIHGFVYELIDYEEEYSEAVFASGGNRINYLVVDDLDTAKQLFEFLKRNKYGRITCIPLKELRINEILNIEQSALKESLGLVKDYIKTKEKYRKVVDFVFGNTILVNDFENAKKFLKLNIRIVTLQGELFEPSNVVSGGFAKNLQFNLNKLEKLEKELTSLIERKKFVFSELQRIRNEMNELRQKRTETDIKLKEHEVMDKLRDDEIKALAKRKQDLNNELEVIHKQLEKTNQELVAVNQHTESIAKRKSEIINLISELEEKQRKLYEQSVNKSEKLDLISKLKSEVEVIKERMNSNEKYKKELNQKFEEIEKSTKTIQEELNNFYNQKKTKILEIENIQSLIKQLDEELGKKSKEYKLLEEEYQNISNERGKLILLREKLMNELQKIEVKLAQTETKYKDLELELKREDVRFEFLDLPKEELENKMKEAEKILNEYGSVVNLKAPEMYAEKAKSVLEAKEKVDKLNEEREAIIKFISEIEEKKKDIFITTFSNINENFRKIFRLIFPNEEGFLELDKPNNPFESGLHIKVIRDNKKKNLESLSGGEKSMLAILLILAMHATKTAPFYIFDEADAALDKENSKKFGQLIRELAKTTQIIVITHNDIVLKYSDKIIGVTKNQNAISEVYGIAIKS